jgi:hypothetical protein
VNGENIHVHGGGTDPINYVFTFNQYVRYVIKVKYIVRFVQNRWTDILEMSEMEGVFCDVWKSAHRSQSVDGRP